MVVCGWHTFHHMNLGPSQYDIESRRVVHYTKQHKHGNRHHHDKEYDFPQRYGIGTIESYQHLSVRMQDVNFVTHL